MNVIYVFRNADKLMRLAKLNKFPKLFYGYFAMKQLISTEYISVGNLNIIRKFLIKIGFCNNMNNFNSKVLKRLNETDIVYATNDGLALQLLGLKKDGELKSLLVINLFAILDNENYSSKMELLRYADRIIVFTKKLKQALTELGYDNIFFIKYGVDTDFYAPLKSVLQENEVSVLGIGLDNKRDWAFFKEVANRFKEISFKVVTKNSVRKYFNDVRNIHFLGNISFVRTREEMQKATLLLLPTKENFYFSGQTTLFNAFSMKKPVIMPYDSYMDDYELDNFLFYNKKNALNEIEEKINLILKKHKRVKESVEFNYNLVKDKYNQMNLAISIITLLKKIKGQSL